MSEMLVVATDSWRADALGGRRVFPFDLPRRVDPATDIWCPGEVAARWLLEADAPPVLRSMGRDWPAAIPPHVDPGPDRRVLSAGERIDFPGTRFVKLADAKDDRFPAAPRTAAQAREELSALGWRTEIIVAGLREFDAEVRVFVAADAIGASTYRIGDDYYDSGLIEPALPSDFRVPDGLPVGVWDFGRRTHDGGWEVIEYNAPWSSAWYGVDPAVVRAAIRDTRLYLPAWRPDAVTLHLAARRARRRR